MSFPLSFVARELERESYRLFNELYQASQWKPEYRDAGRWRLSHVA